MWVPGRMVILLLAASALTALFCLATLGSGQALLPADEVAALKEIAATLGKKDWDFSVDPCSGLNNWTDPNNTDVYSSNLNAVICNCSFVSNTVCHVVTIVLKAQNLSGTLPPELTKLPFLRTIDLTRNYLNGTIPREWGSMQLWNISLLGNRISGAIPKELGNLSTLAALILECNQLTGAIPPELGNLSSIDRLSLTSNYLNGELPAQLARLTTLRLFRISDNQLDGSIPNFIQNWTNLETLAIQGSGLSGPIPSGIASLRNLRNLRISDLKGNNTSFPPISRATNLTSLILRNCNISGSLPEYLAKMTRLRMLDLSFNKLKGTVPFAYADLSKSVDFIFLTGNLLSGLVPNWMMLDEGGFVDVSNNNFSSNAPGSPGRPILFASSSNGSLSGTFSCFGGFCCAKNYYSLHINCGGEEVELDDGNIYERDDDQGGPAEFFQSSTNWVFSSTGSFVDNGIAFDSYIERSSNVSGTGNNVELYKTARLSPLSLTYQAFCLVNGNYTVHLHFSEIMLSDEKTYAGLGRRFFNIYIQKKLVWEDFNIKDEAGEVNKPVIKNFTALVNDTTLEIRFYWAGKGTTAIPLRGSVYGPLISAISVVSDFPPPSEHSLSPGAVVGIVTAVLFIISVVPVILWWKGYLRRKNVMENDLRGLDLQMGSFTLRQIKAATNDFDSGNKIGEGGFGSVYKGHLRDGTIIAVKQLSSKSNQGNREFVNEIGMISGLQHPNLVKLYGSCIEGNQLLLVYEYLENNSLARALFGPKEHQLELDWPTRHKISVGIARGLAYLHEESRLKIVHRDIKATNVLLDKNLNPKISDFGLAKLNEDDKTHISTRIAGTLGYMAPEYAMKGYLTDKADVYSFGIVLLEIVSGTCSTGIKPKEDCYCLLDWASLLRAEGNLKDLIDPRLGPDYNEEEVMLTLHVALLCTNVSPSVRPSMSSCVSMLQGDGGVDKRSVSDELEAENSSEIQMQGVSMEVQLQFTSSTSTSTEEEDLYPNSLESDYLLSTW